MLKRFLDKVSYDALNATIKTEYKPVEGDDTQFQLDSEFEDTSALRNALAMEKADSKKAKAELKAANEKITDLETGTATLSGEASAVEERWKKANEKLKSASGEEKARLEAQLSELLVNAKAEDIAKRVAGDSWELMLPVVTKRLKADLSGDKPATIVLGEDGTDSALNLDALEKEIVANKKYAAIVVKSRASGSGTRPNNGGGGPATAKEFKDMNSAERQSFHETDPTGFAAAVEADQKQRRGY